MKEMLHPCKLIYVKYVIQRNLDMLDYTSIDNYIAISKIGYV